jgi:hypothetical protein
MVRSGQSPTRLKHTLEELVSKGCLDMHPVGNQHRYGITKRGFRYLVKYLADTTKGSMAAIASLGQSQVLREILEDTTLTRVRCKKCGATSWDEGDKKVEIRYEPYDEDIHPDIMVPWYRCGGCGSEVTQEEWTDDRGGPEPDYSNFIQEEVPVETALREARRP